MTGRDETMIDAYLISSDIFIASAAAVPVSIVLAAMLALGMMAAIWLMGGAA